MRKALIVWGGWSGHQPREVAEIFRGMLAAEGFAVEVSDTLDAFKDAAALMGLSLIVPAMMVALGATMLLRARDRIDDTLLLQLTLVWFALLLLVRMGLRVGVFE